MTFLSIPWLELSILFPFVGAVWVSFVRGKDVARSHQQAFCWGTFAFAFIAWILSDGSTYRQIDPQNMISLTRGFFAIDEFSAPLIPLAALLWLVAAMGTMGTKPQQFSFSGNILSEAITIATLSCTHAWGIIVLLGLAIIPPYLDLRTRGRSARVFLIHMLFLSACSLLAGASSMSRIRRERIRQLPLP